MSGKYFISCLGGSEEGVLKDMVIENALVCFGSRKAGMMRRYRSLEGCCRGTDLVRDRRRGKDMRASLYDPWMV